jgi:formiminotetrahydrofolate cyclodeaminase
MADLADRPLSDLLAEVAAPSPAPGGGCSVGWTCAIAAGLVQMAAEITLARDAQAQAPLGKTSHRAGELRAEAVALAERELHSYEPVLSALRLPKTAPERAAQLDAALSEAAETPLALARCAAEIATRAADVVARATPHVQGDAIAGLLLAEGAAQAAARLARINLTGRPQDERLSELSELTTRSAKLRDDVLSAGRS